ncbi:MarR family transcriptional regulator, transcriptional regulator for hemolysin [Geodermatophilus africanus]|uniref:MarR family transcriptional regulator, transcriptional regulator for hemolysin n=1 Tax=Geodermatophilus africanus TaxID=1137993 RepID=A0A1H3GZ06_9ACTN|nr:MarR family transcriptional regulator [Geodermatophilus africanus]SDY07764.1 MarR family transcriptional regulator, transcriptional regulator for hemolysin [Geodermatophilus africanus]
MPRPPGDLPIGLLLDRVAREVSRAFDVRLTAAGGSRPVWLVLLALRRGPVASQRELADALGLRAATLTQQLDTMESAGLVARTADPANRRVHRVELTEAGLGLFDRLRNAARAHDEQLRDGLDGSDVARVAAALERMRRNVGRS